MLLLGKPKHNEGAIGAFLKKKKKFKNGVRGGAVSTMYFALDTQHIDPNYP